MSGMLKELARSRELFGVLLRAQIDQRYNGSALGALWTLAAPLLTMVNSCSASVVVVNIDSGFKGGYVAGLIARRAARTS